MISKRIQIKDAFKKAGKEVVVAGWVSKIRALGKITFIKLRDRTGKLQVVALKNKIDEADFKILEKLTPESTIVIKGRVQESQAKDASHELKLEEFEILTKSEAPLTIDMEAETTTNIDKRIDNRVLDARREKVNAIFQIRSKIFKFAVEFFDKEGFVYINTPKITSSGAESGAELFEVDYFGNKAYLAQSPQMYKQMFVLGGFERVYEIAPVFRAEKSHTNRHLTEFTGVDMEMGFIKDEHDVMNVVENLFKFILKNVKEECKSELALLDVKFNVPKEIPRLKHDEIRKLLKKKGKEIAEDDDLDAEAEALLGKIIKEKYNEDFVFALNYPYKIRPFYHMKPDDDPNGTRSFDLIWNGVEIATGAQREHRKDVFIAQAKEKGVDIHPDYVNIFRFGSIPHGGIGLGLDRIAHRLLELNNIREAVLLPRDPERVTP